MGTSVYQFTGPRVSEPGGLLGQQLARAVGHVERDRGGACVGRDLAPTSVAHRGPSAVCTRIVRPRRAPNVAAVIVTPSKADFMT